MQTIMIHAHVLFAFDRGVLYKRSLSKVDYAHGHICKIDSRRIRTLMRTCNVPWLMSRTVVMYVCMYVYMLVCMYMYVRMHVWHTG